MRHILLIGLRGAGKTTIAQQLSAQLNTPWFDLDDRVRDALDAHSVQHAWHKQGEPTFRAAEADELARALAEPPGIVALGGGTPTAPGAAGTIRNAQKSGNAIVYYLCAPPDVLRQRLAEAVGTTDIQRPSLTGKGLLEEIDDVYNQRDPLYRELATAIIDASGSIDSTTQSILDHLKQNDLFKLLS